MTDTIPLTKPYFTLDEMTEIQSVLDSGWVSRGPKVQEFEDSVKKMLNINYAVALNNCTAALHLALLSLNVSTNDEVIVADYTFPATGHAVLYCNARPIFADINPKTYNINPASLESNITEKTKAIIPVHTFGQPADMENILKIARKYDIKVIEDAACAFGARYKKQYAGTIGDIGCFSFHARKGITTGEGGMIVTKNKEIAERVLRLSMFGMDSVGSGTTPSAFSIPRFIEVGYNYKMSDIHAAVGVAQLKKVDQIIKKRRSLAKYWDDALQTIDIINPPYVSNNVKHIYQSYVGLVHPKVNRNHLIEYLLQNGIQTQIGTYASHIQPVYDYHEICPQSRDVYERAIALPLFYQMDEKQIDEILIVLKKYEKNNLFKH
jgi:dTDP-4-amino-4,6-dideoxygalactose transaminase